MAPSLERSLQFLFLLTNFFNYIVYIQIYDVSCVYTNNIVYSIINSFRATSMPLFFLNVLRCQLRKRKEGKKKREKKIKELTTIFKNKRADNKFKNASTHLLDVILALAQSFAFVFLFLSWQALQKIIKKNSTKKSLSTFAKKQPSNLFIF